MVAGIIFQLISMGFFIGLAIDFMLRATTRRAYEFRKVQIVKGDEKRAAKAAKVADKEAKLGRRGSEKTLTNVVVDVRPQGQAHKATNDLEAQAQDLHESERDNLRNWWILLIGVGISSLMIFIRGKLNRVLAHFCPITSSVISQRHESHITFPSPLCLLVLDLARCNATKRNKTLTSLPLPCITRVLGIYRSVELTQGWSGYLISHEIYQNTLDGIPMVIAVAIYNIIHPMFLLPRKESWTGYH